MKFAVDGPGGRRQAYAYTGGKRFDASLPAIVFIHGAMHDHSDWTLLARWFAHHGHAVLAPDLPGHSQTTGAPFESVEAIADWLLALLDAAGVDEAALVGHSMGSLIALEAAGRAPARVGRLIMVGTAYPMAVSPALLEMGERDPFAAIDSVNALSISTLAGKPSYPGPGTWLHGADRILARRLQMAQTDANLFLTDFRVCDRYRVGLRPRHGTWAATLALGARDQMTWPKHASALAGCCGRGSSPADGTSVMSEDPDALLAAVRGAVAAPPEAPAG
jgi:pimeloyl-ACP methyl ester carboxylesterase